MNKTKYFLLIIFTFILLFFGDNVFALDYCYDVDLYENYANATIDSDCYVVCTYTYQVSSYSYSDSWGTYPAPTRDVDIQIGYYPNSGENIASSNFKILAVDFDATYDPTIFHTHTDKFSLINYWKSVFTNSNVISDPNYVVDSNSFSCPSYIYLDTTNTNELCIDDNGSYCTSNYGDYQLDPTTYFGNSDNVYNYSTWSYEDILLPSEYESNSSGSVINTTVREFVEELYDEFITRLETGMSTATDKETAKDLISQIMTEVLEEKLTLNVDDSSYVAPDSLIDEVNTSYFSIDNNILIIDLLKESTLYGDYRNYISERLTYYMMLSFGGTTDGDEISYSGGTQANNIITEYFPDITEEEITDILSPVINESIEIFYADFVEADSSLGEILGGALECDALLGNPEVAGEPAYYLQLALNVLRYVAIVALVLLSTIDYTKAVASSDADALQQANQRVIKRVIYTVILFMFPSVLEFVFNLTGIYDNPLCGLQ